MVFIWHNYLAKKVILQLKILFYMQKKKHNKTYINWQKHIS